MDDEYYEVTSQLDAREILRYLNNLGIHNISGEVLKYFITDLKKFIKYDLQQRNNKNSYREEQWAERLHSASTFSSRVKSKALEGEVLTCYRGCHSNRKLNIRNIHSAPTLGQKAEDKQQRRACSCVREEKKEKDIKLSQVKVSSSNNLIKIPKQPPKKKCDPVRLYHYYTSLWAKYKPNVPGENNWSDLRWSVRQKMAGSVKESLNAVPESCVKVKIIDK